MGDPKPCAFIVNHLCGVSSHTFGILIVHMLILLDMHILAKYSINRSET